MSELYYVDKTELLIWTEGVPFILPTSDETCQKFVKIQIYLDTIQYLNTSKFRHISDKFHETEGYLFI
jgi:hypothetical protein